VILRELVGDEAFSKAIQEYLKTHLYKNVTIKDFINEVAQASNMDLSEFRQKWLENKIFPTQEVERYLKAHSKEIKLLLEDDEKALFQEIELLASEKLKSVLISTSVDSLSAFQIKKLLKDNQQKVNQALLNFLPVLPPESRTDFESLLTAESYQTQELALLRLWMAFPAYRIQYLEKMEGQTGFRTQNIRILWLALALVTDDFRTQKKPDFHNELVSYSYPLHGFETQQLAFDYLRQIGGFEQQSLKNLVSAASHHPVWRFREYCRHLLDEVLKDGLLRQELKKLLQGLDVREEKYLREKLN
jgi:aminopeptidase N